MTQINLLRQVKNLNFPEGFLINGKIVTSVSSGNLTVSLKTLAGTDPTVYDPIYCRIDGVVRTITSACTITINAGANYFNAGSSELATKEIDYFVYLSSFGGPAVARIPYATSFADNLGGEKLIENTGAFSSSDKLVNIGRFSATLSAGPSHTWSLGTGPVINYPIFETRWLDFTPSVIGTTGAIGTYAQINPTGKYRLNGNAINFIFGMKITDVGSWSGHSLLRTPMSSSLNSDLILGAGGIMNGNNGTFKTTMSPYNNSTEYINFTNNFGVAFGQYSLISANDYIMGNISYNI